MTHLLSGRPYFTVNRYTLYTAILFLFTGFTHLSAQLTPFDLNQWTEEGRLNGIWTVSEGGDSVEQELNNALTFFVGPDTFINSSFTGQVSKLAPADDDDFFGFVLGYKRPVGEEDYFEFILLDWKSVTQTVGGRTANAGLTLSRIKGPISGNLGGSIHPYWDHTDSSMTVLASMYQDTLGWKAGKVYTFDLVYQSDRIIVRIDGKSIFDVNGTFEPGRFGFYNYTQPRVRWSDFFSNQIPRAFSDSLTIYEDSTGIINVTANDFDVEGHPFSISTTQSNPQHGSVGVVAGDSTIQYIPDADFNGTDSFEYRITDGYGGFGSATVFVTVLPVNDDPFVKQNIPDTELIANGKSYFHVRLNDYLKDADANDSPLDSFTVVSSGNIQPMLSGDSLFLISAGFLELDTIMVMAWDDSGRSVSTTFTALTQTTVVIEQTIAATPVKFNLEQNYPNPFNPVTTIGYQIPVNGEVSLKIYDALGREIRTLVDTHQTAGRYSVTFNAAYFPSGVYFYTLQAGNFNQTRMMLLLK